MVVTIIACSTIVLFQSANKTSVMVVMRSCPAINFFLASRYALSIVEFVVKPADFENNVTDTLPAIHIDSDTQHLERRTE